MKYKVQITGWLISGIMSIGIGFIENVFGFGYRFVYLGIFAIIIAVLTYYLTNTTDIFEKVAAKNKKTRPRK